MEAATEESIVDVVVDGIPPTPSTTSTTTMKGKRTKRARPTPPPLSFSAASSTSATDDRHQHSSSSTSSLTEEEEDMANCLILLAQSAVPPPPRRREAAVEKFVSRRFAEAATSTAAAKAGLYVYECKTCSKCFPSFQALGGHRTSHKRPKRDSDAAGDLDHAPPSREIIFSPYSVPKMGNSSSASKPRRKTHECSICGAEFVSGQALGGHMRRHRAPPAPSPAPEKNLLSSLDLNLPAAEEERRGGGGGDAALGSLLVNVGGDGGNRSTGGQLPHLLITIDANQ